MPGQIANAGTNRFEHAREDHDAAEHHRHGDGAAKDQHGGAPLALRRASLALMFATYSSISSSSPERRRMSTCCLSPIARLRAQERQPPVPPVDEVKHEADEQPARAEDSSERMGEQREEQDRKDSDETDDGDERKLGALSAHHHRKVERNLELTRTQRIAQTQADEAEKDQRVARCRAERVEIGEEIQPALPTEEPA